MAKETVLTKRTRKNSQPLIWRYLLWCYKTTKEQLDWIDRKFTQLVVDEYILRELRRPCILQGNREYLRRVKDFEKYINEKKEKAHKAKFSSPSSGAVTGEYIYLSERLLAIEKAITHFLGKKELKKIQELYQKEMIQRILSSRDHT